MVFRHKINQQVLPHEASAKHLGITLHVNLRLKELNLDKNSGKFTKRSPGPSSDILSPQYPIKRYHTNKSWNQSEHVVSNTGDRTKKSDMKIIQIFKYKVLISIADAFGTQTMMTSTRIRVSDLLTCKKRDLESFNRT